MALKKVDQQVTSVYTQLGSYVYAGLANDDGLVIIGWFHSTYCATPPTTASIFAPGCIMFNKAGTSTTTNIFTNTGTTASVTWALLTLT